jgi:large subunit ribosomal protein L6
LGALSQKIENEKIDVKIADGEVSVVRLSEEPPVRAAHGLYRALIYNMVCGVQKAFEVGLIINGVGYKSQKQGNKVVLNIGFSHPVEVVAPAGITIDCVTPTELLVKGIDKVAVGQCAASIKAIKKPEPYHGYGIRYKTETITLKEGKTAGKK